jgi:hypothetical protein
MKRKMFFSALCVSAGCFAVSTTWACEPNSVFKTANTITNFCTEVNFCADSTAAITGNFKTVLPNVPEEILKIFHRDFPNVQHQTVYHVGDSYMIYFKNENVAYRIYYNTNGDIQQTIKYYSAEDLAPFIRSKVNSKYKGKNISSVTDVTSDTGHFYQIVLEDSKSWTYLNVNEQGFIQVKKKLQKQK